MNSTIFVLAALSAIAVFAFDGLAGIFDVIVHGNELRIVLFRCFSIKALRFQDVEYIIKGRPVRSFSALNLVNRMFKQRYVIVLKDNFFTKMLVVTPKDGVEFEKLIQAQGVRME